jgi:hypothetical protein
MSAPTAIAEQVMTTLIASADEVVDERLPMVVLLEVKVEISPIMRIKCSY